MEALFEERRGEVLACRSACLAIGAPQLWERHPHSPPGTSTLGLGDSVAADPSPRSGVEQMTQAPPFRATPLTTTGLGRRTSDPRPG